MHWAAGIRDKRIVIEGALFLENDGESQWRGNFSSCGSYTRLLAAVERGGSAMKWILGALVIAVGAGCSSDGGKNGPGAGSNNSSNGGSSGSSGSGPGTAACPDPSKMLVPASEGGIGAMGIDDANVYLLRNGTGIYSVPKSGGDPKALFEGERFFLMLKNELLVNGDTIYFGDTDGIYKMPLAGGEPKVWIDATNMEQKLASDADYIYFLDDTDDHDGMPHGSVKKAKKADGQVTTLASGQAGPTGILLAGDTLYWQNVGSAKSGLLERASDGGLMSVSKNGGSPRTLFTPKTDGSGIQLAGSLSDLAADGTSVYFGSVNLEAFEDSGTFKVAVGGGAPQKLDNLLTVSAFIDGGSLFVDNGDRIAKVALSSGAETDLACFDPMNGSVMMVHDDSHVYFMKGEGNDQYGVRSLSYR
jgi:hypothetical protein